MIAAPLIAPMSFSRVAALCRKEWLQIVRDPSSILIAFVLPAILLFIFGYGVNLDSASTRVALVSDDGGTAARSLAAAITAADGVQVTEFATMQDAERALLNGSIRGYVRIPSTFGQSLASGQAPELFLGIDASEPNTASLVAGNLEGIWASWQSQWHERHGPGTAIGIPVEARSWFNPSAESRNFLVPGSIAIIMTILGALLTSLVIAREWERGTMEALLAARVTKLEILLSKFIPYYVLAIAAMATCMVIAVGVMGVPFRGSLWMVWLVTTLFLGGTLGMGLLISTVTRNQFNAAQSALNLGYMPAVIFSGFVYEIASMPRAVQVVADLLPARYFMSSLQTLFQAGIVWPTLLRDIAFLAVTSVAFIGLTVAKTRETLE